MLAFGRLSGGATSSTPCATSASEGTTMHMGSQRAQSAQHRCLHLRLDVPVVLHIGVSVHDDLHDRVLVERPGCPEGAAQALPLSHPLVRDAMRTAHPCTCEQPWSGLCRLGLLHSRHTPGWSELVGRRRRHVIKPGASLRISIPWVQVSRSKGAHQQDLHSGVWTRAG